MKVSELTALLLLAALGAVVLLNLHIHLGDDDDIHHPLPALAVEEESSGSHSPLMKSELDQQWHSMRLNYSWFCSPHDRAGFWKNHPGQTKKELQKSVWIRSERNTKYWCDKLEMNLDQWQPATRYTIDDFAIGVFTGRKFYKKRALVSRDTWFDRAPHAYFYSQDPDSWLPVVELPGVGEDSMSALKKQLLGLVDLFDKHPDMPWYYVIGCDFLVLPDYLIKKVEAFDHTRPLFLGGSIGIWDIPSARMRKPDEYQDFHPSWEGVLRWPSGGGGFILSNALMRELVPTLPDFAHNVWTLNSNAADCATALAIRCLGYEVTTMPDGQEHFYPFPAEKSVGVKQLASEMVGWHYVFAHKFFYLDQYMIHEKIDRLLNTPLLPDLVSFFRQFVDAHFVTMVKKYEEMQEVMSHVETLEKRVAQLEEQLQQSRNSDKHLL